MDTDAPGASTRGRLDGPTLRFPKRKALAERAIRMCGCLSVSGCFAAIGV
jgi:hypothetical protein